MEVDSHEHPAGCMLLAALLNNHVEDVEAVVHRGWPKKSDAFDNASTIVVYSDGGEGHLMIPHLDQVAEKMKQGVGLALLHYAVEVPKGKPGDCFLDWIGGYFEMHWSVNHTGQQISHHFQSILLLVESNLSH